MENTNKTYEELVQLKESGEIGWREFIRRQPEMEDGYYHWSVGASLSADSRKWRMATITGAWITTST